jgi:hypothetical protein
LRLLQEASQCPCLPHFEDFGGDRASAGDRLMVVAMHGLETTNCTEYLLQAHEITIGRKFRQLKELAIQPQV